MTPSQRGGPRGAAWLGDESSRDRRSGIFSTGPGPTLDYSTQVPARGIGSRSARAIRCGRPGIATPEGNDALPPVNGRVDPGQSCSRFSHSKDAGHSAEENTRASVTRQPARLHLVRRLHGRGRGACHHVAFREHELRPWSWFGERLAVAAVSMPRGRMSHPLRGRSRASICFERRSLEPYPCW